jgi:HPr kinase/phosphorylase
LKAGERNERFLKLCKSSMPAFIFSRSYQIPGPLKKIAREHNVPLMLSPLETRHLINATTIALENDFAPTITEYGSMVDITGIGVLIKGASGVGKSECVLGLIERGHSLVSDDITKVRNIEGLELSGTAMELGRNYMEVRGLGIIDVPAIFGIGSIRLEKRLDLIVTLKDWQEIEEIDRIGLDQDFAEILGIRVPHVIIPVRSGRDIARLVEVAALDQRLKSMGHNSALEFNQKLINYMQNKAG